MTRSEHLQWCKERALAYVHAGDLPQAYASFASDMGKHPETSGHIALKLGAKLLFAGRLETKPEMERFINGFH